MFGNLYELGPAWVNESLQLVHNPGKVCLLVQSTTCSGAQRMANKMLCVSWQLQPFVMLTSILYMTGAWNHRFGLLFIDQPVGSGFSIAGNACTYGLVTSSLSALCC